MAANLPKGFGEKPISVADAAEYAVGISEAMKTDKTPVEKNKLEFSIADGANIITYRNGAWMAAPAISNEAKEAIKGINRQAVNRGIPSSLPPVIPELEDKKITTLKASSYYQGEWGKLEGPALEDIIDGKTYPKLKNITLNFAQLSGEGAQENFVKALNERVDKHMTVTILAGTNESVFHQETGEWTHKKPPFKGLKKIEEAFKEVAKPKNGACNTVHPVVEEAVNALKSSGVQLMPAEKLPPIGNYAGISPASVAIA